MKVAKLSLVSALILLSMGTICQAQSSVQLYGVVDTGIGVTKEKGKAAKVIAVNGGNSASRWGIKGQEDLGNGHYVKFVLEQGFKPSNGEPQTSGVLFDRDSLLIIGGNWGELGFGRSGSLMGTTGYYGQFPAMGVNPMQSNYLDAAVIGSFVNSGMLNNSITYKVTPLQGLTFAAQYSNGISTDDQKWSKNNHYYGFSANYKTNGWSFGGIFTLIQYRSAGTYNGADSEDTKNLLLTVNKAIGDWRLYASVQHVWNARNLGGGPNAFYAKDLGFGTAAQLKGSKKGFRSDSFMIGANHPLGAGKIFAAFKWNFGKWQGDSFNADADRKGNRWVASLKYSYPLSKRTQLYAVGTYSQGHGMYKKYEAKANRFLSAFGICHNF